MKRQVLENKNMDQGKVNKDAVFNTVDFLKFHFRKTSSGFFKIRYSIIKRREENENVHNM